MRPALPLFDFVGQSGATVITVPTVNADHSPPAPNAKLRLRNLYGGIVLMPAPMSALMTLLMTGLGTEWGPRS